MSASRNKKERKNQVEAPETQSQPAKKGMSRGLKTTLGIVCAVLVVAVVVFFTMVTTGFFNTHTTAAVASGHKLSPAMVNYYYRSAVQNLSQYASYIGVDTTKSLADQVYDAESGQSWADVLLDQALTQAAQTYAIYDEAIANGYTMPDADAEAIDTTISALEYSATMNGLANSSAYLAAVYGNGCNVDNFREYITVDTIVNGYRQQINDGFTYTADDLDAEYNADPAKYDTFTYRQFLVTDTLFQTDDNALSEEELTEKKEALASEMAAASYGDEQAFIDMAYENALDTVKESYEDPDYTLRSYTGSGLLESQLEWLSDASRQEGDTTYINADGTYYVLYFVARGTNDFNLPNIRDIPFSATDTNDETAMEEARTNAENALAEYENGEQTADSFAALVQKYTNSDTADGLTENVQPGTGSDEYNTWCFDSARQTGDVAVVQTSTGYSVLYFDGYGDTYRNVLVETALRSNDYSAWYSSVTENASYTEQSYGMRFVSK